MTWHRIRPGLYLARSNGFDYGVERVGNGDWVAYRLTHREYGPKTPVGNATSANGAKRLCKQHMKAAA